MTIIDVNFSRDNAILQKSESLRGYSYLIDRIKSGKDQGLTRDKAIKEAIDHCIQEGILEEFLKENYEEAAKMLRWEYDQEEEFDAIREEVRENEREKYEAKLAKSEAKLNAKIRMLEEQLRLAHS